jgi:hypothetical protein
VGYPTSPESTTVFLEIVETTRINQEVSLNVERHRGQRPLSPIKACPESEFNREEKRTSLLIL